MKKLVLITLVALFVFQSCTQKTKNEEEISTYYLIRHAEKDRSDKTNRNPNLMEVGLQRAESWARHFKDIKFDVIYSTDTNRTRQTATPTAKANNLALQLYYPDNMDMEEFMLQNKGKTVLIVGHSDTTPMLTNAILGEHKYPDISDDNNSNLYTITVTKDSRNATLSVVPVGKNTSVMKL